jgi:hypothetical protein
LNALEKASRLIDQGGNKILGPADVVGKVFAQPVAMPIQVIIKAPGKSPARSSQLLAPSFLYLCTYRC